MYNLPKTLISLPNARIANLVIIILNLPLKTTWSDMVAKVNKYLTVSCQALTETENQDKKLPGNTYKYASDTANTAEDTKTFTTFEAGEGSVPVIAGLVCSHFQLHFEMKTQISAMKPHMHVFLNLKI